MNTVFLDKIVFIIILIYTTAIFQILSHLGKDRPTAYKHAHTVGNTESKSDSRMIEVCTRLSSEPVQAAALSEHAPDEVSQGVERAVITGSLEGR